jgi:hypothetical protein
VISVDIVETTLLTILTPIPEVDLIGRPHDIDGLSTEWCYLVALQGEVHLQGAPLLLFVVARLDAGDLSELDSGTLALPHLDDLRVVCNDSTHAQTGDRTVHTLLLGGIPLTCSPDWAAASNFSSPPRAHWWQ